jgi:hypothetical protein
MLTLQEAQAAAVRMVFEAVNEAGATPEAMQFQYMQMLPKLAENPANKIIVVPADMAGLAGLATSITQLTQQNGGEATPALPEGTKIDGRGFPQLNASPTTARPQ